MHKFNKLKYLLLFKILICINLIFKLKIFINLKYLKILKNEKL